MTFFDKACYSIWENRQAKACGKESKAMANVQARKNKEGRIISYSIRVYRGDRKSVV